VVVLAVAVAAAGSARDASAQLKGHYIPGFTGLANGSQAPPGVNLILPIYFYTTDTLKDDNGDALGVNPRVNASFLGPGVAWVTNLKLLGGNWGGQALPIAFMKSRIEGNSLDVPGSLKFTDIYFQPLQLGWHQPRADYTVGWGFFAPTGSWELGGDNGGLGMWSNDFQAGATLRLDDKRAWATSLLATFEIHSKKKDTELQVGDILTLEGGTGKSFYKKIDGTPIPQIASIGLVYYGQFKVTSDEGPLGGTRFFEGKKDHVFGVGLEGSLYLPKPKLFLSLRVLPELGAVDRSQGWTFLLSLAYEVKSLVKLPPHP
jgi:hypothetical protein